MQMLKIKRGGMLSTTDAPKTAKQHLKGMREQEKSRKRKRVGGPQKKGTKRSKKNAHSEESTGSELEVRFVWW